MASAETSGQHGVSQRSLSARLECIIIAIMWGACYVRRALVGNSPSSERPNAMSKPLKTGMRGAGQPLKKSRGGRTDHRLGRRIGLLSVADGRADLGTTWADPRSACAVDPRSPLGHQWHHPRWAAVSASASGVLQCSGGGRRASRVLLRKIPGKLLLIWDGSPIHRGQEVKDFLKRGAAKRLHLEQLPGYAPDLNPDEGIWNSLKRVELGNISARV